MANVINEQSTLVVSYGAVFIWWGGINSELSVYISPEINDNLLSVSYQQANRKQVNQVIYEYVLSTPSNINSY